MTAAMLLVLYAALAGALSAFAFEPVGWWPLMFVAIAAVCEILSRTDRLWKAVLIGWAFGLLQFTIGLNWIATAFTFQAKMPPALGWLAVVLLSIYLAVYPAVATAIAWRFGRNDRLSLLLTLAGAWSITEWLRGTIFTGFPWNPLAAVLAPTPLITMTPLTGTYGLSAFVILLSGAAWLEIYRKWLPMVVIFGVTALLWLLPSTSIPDDPLAVLNVRVVQPNIGQEGRWDPANDAATAEKLAALTSPPSGEPRLILWPESAVIMPMQDQRAGAAPAAEFERKRAARVIGPNDRLIAGGVSINSSDGQRIDSVSNSVFALGPGGQVLGRYDKAHLVPYGEYLPMRPLLSSIGLARLAPGDVDFQPGPGPRTMELGGNWVSVGLQLCYEIIFSGRVVDNTHRPNFIFNPSNDSWFGRWGPPQHLAQARLRAAEEGLPVIRATPTGISAVIDAHGTVVKSLPWRTEGVIDAVLPPPSSSTTLFGRLGNLLPILIGIGLVVMGWLFRNGAIVLRRERR